MFYWAGYIMHNGYTNFCDLKQEKRLGLLWHISLDSLNQTLESLFTQYCVHGNQQEVAYIRARK